MEKEITIAIIAAVPTSLMVILTWLEVRKSREDTKKEIREVHLSLNSRLDEMLKSARGEARAEGREEGRNE